MPRLKNEQWDLSELPGRSAGGGRTYSNSTIQLALLMDIRDELQQLNRLLGCDNFQAIPDILRGIRRKLPQKRRKRRAK